MNYARKHTPMELEEQRARWPEVRAVLESALDMPPARREEFLEAACGSDSELLDRVRSLIVAHDADVALEHGVDFSALFDPWPGLRIGPWLVKRLVGKGGMGAVYEAERADNQYRQRVAIKLLSATALAGGAARRFWKERQFLARLEHPNIARLLDGGATADGVPFLVMEFVDGEPIDVYCRQSGVTIPGILRLFLAVCSAVAHAHRNLIVHRDIKPGNILVTREGVPKLLDFGIAKPLVDAEDLTRSSQRPMTPAYASPEQVRGEPLNTATDVYSLGVLLYQLLTGGLPYRAEAGKLEQAILEQEPASPSSAARDQRVRQQLRGDLDAIVLTALRKEQTRRYASAERLAEDIERFLKGLPVSARKDTATYRARKFIRRHRAAVIAGALFAIGLVAAAGISLEFAEQARVERARAESRFQDVRRLANFFLFDFDDAIRAGPTASRKSVVEKGLQYLDRLASSSAGDLALQRELLAGYRKIGDLRGNIYESNLGDVTGATASYLHALRIAQALRASDPYSLRSRLDLALVYQDLSDITATVGKRTQALDYSNKAMMLLDPPASWNGECVRAALEAHARIAWLHYRVGEYGESLAHYERYGALARQFYGEHPSDLQERRTLAFSWERTGELLARMGNTKEGLLRLSQALQEYQNLLRLEASDRVELSRDIANVHTILGDLLWMSGHSSESLSQFRAGLAGNEALLTKDPSNSEYRRDLFDTLSQFGTALYSSGNRQEAQTVTARAFQTIRETLDGGSASEYDLQQYVLFLVTTPLAQYQNTHAARHYAERLVQMTEGGDPRMLDFLGRALYLDGEAAEGAKAEQRALALLPPGVPSDLRSTIQKNISKFQRLAR